MKKNGPRRETRKDEIGGKERGAEQAFGAQLI